MYNVYCQDGELCESYETLAEAIQDTIVHWHEGETPSAFTVRCELSNGKVVIVATICPVGANAAFVVTETGHVHRYNAIQYDLIAKTTRFNRDNADADTVIAW